MSVKGREGVDLFIAMAHEDGEGLQIRESFSGLKQSRESRANLCEYPPHAGEYSRRRWKGQSHPKKPLFLEMKPSVSILMQKFQAKEEAFGPPLNEGLSGEMNPKTSSAEPRWTSWRDGSGGEWWYSRRLSQIRGEGSVRGKVVWSA